LINEQIDIVFPEKSSGIPSDQENPIECKVRLVHYFEPIICSFFFLTFVIMTNDFYSKKRVYAKKQ